MSTQPIYAIKDKAPELPCSIYAPSAGWNYFEVCAIDPAGYLQLGYTHWCKARKAIDDAAPRQKKPRVIRPPAEIADHCEMMAQHRIDEGSRESAALFMEPAHAIRRALLTLHRLNQRVHTGYDFNADPDKMTLEVGEVLKGYTQPMHTK